MAKTYNTFTNVATGDVYTAASHNAILTNLAGYRVPPAARVTRASQNINNSTWTFVDTWVQDYDTDDMWTTPNNYVEIQTAGVYLIAWGGSFASNATGSRIASLSLNDTGAGAGAIAGGVIGRASNAATSQDINGSVVQTFVAADKLRLSVWQNSTVTLALTSAYITATWLGQVS